MYSELSKLIYNKIFKCGIGKWFQTYCGGGTGVKYKSAYDYLLNNINWSVIDIVGLFQGSTAKYMLCTMLREQYTILSFVSKVI